MSKAGSVPSSHATDWREGRRLRAWELHEQGWSGKAIAEALKASQAAVSTWLKRARSQDSCALSVVKNERREPGSQYVRAAPSSSRRSTFERGILHLRSSRRRSGRRFELVESAGSQSHQERLAGCSHS